MAALIVGLPSIVSTWDVASAAASASLNQCANDKALSLSSDGCEQANEWENGNLGASKSVYSEGDSIPYRMLFGDLALGTHTVTIEWDTTKGGKHAIDYLTDFDRTVTTADPCAGVAGCVLNAGFDTVIPVDPQLAPVVPVIGHFTMWGGTVNSVSAYSYAAGSGFAGDKSARLTLTFTATAANPVLAWGGHIATRQDWGLSGSAIAISGSPYHTRLIDLDGSGGNQDRSLSAAAVIFPSSITIVKDATPNGATSFPFTASPSPLTAFSLVDDGTTANTRVFSNITAFTTYSVAETVPAGWTLTGRVCSVTSPNGGSQTESGASGVSINLKEGENVTCTFSNTRLGTVELTKVWSGTPGSTTLNIGTAAGGSQVASQLVTANGTTGTKSVAAGTYFFSETALAGFSTALVCTKNGTGITPGANNPVAVANTDVVVCTFTNTRLNPALSLDKTASPATYNTLNQVISYSYLVTNTGNVAFAGPVTVTDDKATVTCPAGGLAVGASTTCTASYTITQADLDGTGVTNVAQASANGTNSNTDTETVTAVRTPALTIVKTATPTSYSSVGAVISYSYLVTNSGNVTLSGPFTVSDDKSSDESCPALVPNSLAPGASTTCTASYTISQADIDAGSVTNIASASNGTVTSPTDTETVTAVQRPSISLTKVANPTTYTGIGQVISYTLVATNDGNVTLTDVTLTDPMLGTLTCVPVQPATLAVTDSMTCSGSYTTVAADLQVSSITNTATTSGLPPTGARVSDTAQATVTRDTGSIELKKVWVGAGGQTTLNIGTSAGTGNTDTQQTGASGAGPLTTGANVVPTGTFYVSETGGLTDYVSSLACTRNTIAFEAGANGSVTVGLDDVVVCTFTNSLKPRSS